MRTVQFDGYGPPEVLQVRSVPIPRVSAGTVLVRVAATSINAADVLIRSGKLRLFSGRKFPRGTGFDFAGEIVETGSGVHSFRNGDAVWGFLDGIRKGPSAAAAEYVLAPVNSIALRPHTIDAAGAAALSGAGGAALGVLRDTLRLRQGERILIRGASGGVGVAAVQIARAMGGRVTALVRASQIDRVRGIGADEAFDYKTVYLRKLGRFDCVFDPVAKNLKAFHRLLAPGGRMVVLTIGSASDAAYWAISSLFESRRIRFVQAPPSHERLSSLTEFVDVKGVMPVIDGLHTLDNIAAAHRALETGGVFGKHVVQLT